MVKSVIIFFAVFGTIVLFARFMDYVIDIVADELDELHKEYHKQLLENENKF
jgi:hypothetical protein